MFLQQILDVDEKNQLVSLNAWLSYVRDVNWIPPGVLKFVCKLDVTWLVKSIHFEVITKFETKL
ncbi:unnamed protein product [Strongylus vulgaris]|uniref:Neurotransmitter-gated ion-channel ligand-binding domain-containing protein n=1 Tax=Strongylus vulgaris TaxID=40348 RepID=A0A3P7JYD9_STRVU|nr:unnamed protein product [Strongylus vulgaris]